MSASPMLEMTSKSIPNSREGTKKETAGGENNFDQVLNQKINSRTASKPQSLSKKVVTVKGDEEESSQAPKAETASKIDEPVAKGESKKDSKVTEKGKKEEAIKKFMDSFESEFQIPPTRLVEVISQLTPEQLNESAEQTAESVIGQLNLDPQAELKAKQKYLGLIQDLNQNAVAQQQPVFVPELGMMSMGMGLTQERFQRMKSNREALQKSIDQMNQIFWQPRPQQPKSIDVATPLISNMGLEAEGQGMSLYNNFELLDEGNLLMKDFSDSLPGMEKPSLDSSLYKAKEETNSQPQQNVKGLEAQTQKNQQEAEILASLGLMNPALSDESSLVPSARSEVPTQGNKIPSMLSETPSLAGNAAAIVSKLDVSSNRGEQNKDSSSYGESALVKNMSKGKETKSKGEDLKALFAAQLGLEAQATERAKGEVVTQAAPLKDLSQNEIDKNIQSVMNQAQYLVKKGGGEVKVKMTPEGLGQIQLKVELVDGKVQMQMLTENKETKKILESNMNELKDHLSSNHKLAVESIKIDSVQGASTDVATRNQNSSDNMSQNPNSDRQTKQFWNQFQEQFGRGSQREALFDNPKVKGYAQKKSTTIAPTETVSTESVSNKKRSGLNLVA